MTELQLTGIGLRTPHCREFLEKKPNVAWVEVHAENYFADGGKPIQIITDVRKNYPVSLHGVGLSLGSSDDLNWQHLKNLRDLCDRIDPCLVSEHLSWSSTDGHHLHDLLPIPYTKEALVHIVNRVIMVQEFLGRQILIENPSSYLTFNESEIPEWEFIKTLAEKSGCGILLDVNNIYVSAKNIGFDPNTYLHAIPKNYVHEIHLAGFSISSIADKEILIDTHSKPVHADVWDLFKKTIAIMGTKPTIIEWDADLPALQTLYDEATYAEKIMREINATSRLTG